MELLNIVEATQPAAEGVIQNNGNQRKRYKIILLCLILAIMVGELLLTMILKITENDLDSCLHLIYLLYCSSVLLCNGQVSTCVAKKFERA